MSIEHFQDALGFVFDWPHCHGNWLNGARDFGRCMRGGWARGLGWFAGRVFFAVGAFGLGQVVNFTSCLALGADSRDGLVIGAYSFAICRLLLLASSLSSLATNSRFCAEVR